MNLATKNKEYVRLWNATSDDAVARAILMNRLIPIEERLSLAEKELNPVRISQTANS